MNPVLAAKQQAAVELCERITAVVAEWDDLKPQVSALTPETGNS